jgi:DNA-binding HxlR family transcriptional regulator
MDALTSPATKSCVARTTQIIGDKWTPLLITALSGGTLRFCELQNLAGGLNPRTLSARLDNLEAEKIITKETFSSVPPKVEYTLTQKGNDLIPVLKSMAEWGEKYISDCSL